MGGRLPVEDGQDHDVLATRCRPETEFQELAAEIGRGQQSAPVDPFVVDGRRFASLDRNGHFLDPIAAFRLDRPSAARVRHGPRDAEQTGGRVGLRDGRDVLQVDEQIPGRRLEQLVAGQRQNGHLSTGVEELVQLERAAEEDGVVGLQVLFRQNGIVDRRFGRGAGRGGESRLANVEIDVVVHLF